MVCNNVINLIRTTIFNCNIITTFIRRHGSFFSFRDGNRAGRICRGLCVLTVWCVREIEVKIVRNLIKDYILNNIDLNSFALLTEHLIKELIGRIGDRARFPKKLKDWNAQMTNPFEESQHPIQDFKSNGDSLNAQHRAVKDITDLPLTSQTAQEATSLLPLGSIDLDNTSPKEVLNHTLEGRALMKFYSEYGLLSTK